MNFTGQKIYTQQVYSVRVPRWAQNKSTEPINVRESSFLRFDDILDKACESESQRQQETKELTEAKKEEKGDPLGVGSELNEESLPIDSVDRGGEGTPPSNYGSSTFFGKVTNWLTNAIETLDERKLKVKNQEEQTALANLMAQLKSALPGRGVKDTTLRNEIELLTKQISPQEGDPLYLRRMKTWITSELKKQFT